MLNYGPIKIDPPLVLAPMAGVTDRQFRLILRRVGGVGLVTMEFISSEALVRHNERTLRMMHYCEEERPISIQIYGSDAHRMADFFGTLDRMSEDSGQRLPNFLSTHPDPGDRRVRVGQLADQWQSRIDYKPRKEKSGEFLKRLDGISHGAR